MKTIYFVRHGQSQANSLGISAGSEFDTPLTNNGRTQAKKTGEELKDKNIELIVATPLERTRETAQIIAREIGNNPEKIIEKPYFIERHMGVFSGGLDEEYLKAVHSGEPLHESVETVEAMHKRITKGLEWVAKRRENIILLVSHGGASRILRMIHQDLPHSHMYKLDRLENAAIYEFTL